MISAGTKLITNQAAGASRAGWRSRVRSGLAGALNAQGQLVPRTFAQAAIAHVTDNSTLYIVGAIAAAALIYSQSKKGR